jgi:hypothetical protein
MTKYETERIQHPTTSKSACEHQRPPKRDIHPRDEKTEKKQKTRKTVSWNAYCQWLWFRKKQHQPNTNLHTNVIKQLNHIHPLTWALHSSSSSQHCCHQWSDRIYDRITLDLQFEDCGKQLSWQREREREEREREREERERARESAREQ